jgi:serine/threonine protein kinase
MSFVREQTETGIIIDIPREFQDYTYIHTIGSASSSVVALVKDREGSQFAAKIVSRAGLISEQRLECFERELRILEFMRHPNVVALHDVVYLPNTIAVITEYCDQGDLFDYLVNSGPLDTASLRRFLYQILQALQCLHEKGYAHRDLKPENIFVKGTGCIKMGDFGLSKAATWFTRTMCGTLNYTAPEVLEQKPYDARKADIWSLGILVYVMTSLGMPWSSSDQMGVAAEIKTGVIRFPLGFPRHVTTLIELCTAMDPEARPTARRLLEIPWISEEQATWVREFRSQGGRGRASNARWGKPAKGSVARDSGKFILSEAHFARGRRLS